MSSYGWRRDARYKVRRLVETPRAFSNWVPVLRDMALGAVNRGPATLHFDTRSGVSIDAPNRPGARVPVYEIFAEDCYRLQWWLGELIARPITVVDIGGHIGTFSCRLTQLHPEASVLAFEPSATTASYLRKNLAQNGVADRVQVFDRALAASSGRATFADNGAGSGLNGLQSAGRTAGTATEVETIGFDDVVALAGGHVDAVKIDCEGGEYDLVLASAPESWSTVARVVLEFHPVEGHSWDELREFFAGVGLHVQDQDMLNGYGCVWLSRDALPRPSA